MEEKCLREAKIKGSVKQKEDESPPLGKEHSETMVLNEIQSLTKIFSVLQGLLLCGTHTSYVLSSRKQSVYFILSVVPLVASPPPFAEI